MFSHFAVTKWIDAPLLQMLAWRPDRATPGTTRASRPPPRARRSARWDIGGWTRPDRCPTRRCRQTSSWDRYSSAYSTASELWAGKEGKDSHGWLILIDPVWIHLGMSSNWPLNFKWCCSGGNFRTKRSRIISETCAFFYLIHVPNSHTLWKKLVKL